MSTRRNSPVDLRNLLRNLEDSGRAVEQEASSMRLTFSRNIIKQHQRGVDHSGRTLRVGNSRLPGLLALCQSE